MVPVLLLGDQTGRYTVNLPLSCGYKSLVLFPYHFPPPQSPHASYLTPALPPPPLLVAHSNSCEYFGAFFPPSTPPPAARREPLISAHTAQWWGCFQWNGLFCQLLAFLLTVSKISFLYWSGVLVGLCGVGRSGGGVCVCGALCVGAGTWGERNPPAESAALELRIKGRLPGVPFPPALASGQPAGCLAYHYCSYGQAFSGLWSAGQATPSN